MLEQVRQEGLELLEGKGRSPESSLQRGILRENELGKAVRMAHATTEGEVIALDADDQVPGAIGAYQPGEDAARFSRQPLGKPQHAALLPTSHTLAPVGS